MNNQNLIQLDKSHLRALGIRMQASPLQKFGSVTLVPSVSRIEVGKREENEESRTNKNMAGTMKKVSCISFPNCHLFP